jgi:hypothetical protein
VAKCMKLPASSLQDLLHLASTAQALMMHARLLHMPAACCSPRTSVTPASARRVLSLHTHAQWCTHNDTYSGKMHTLLATSFLWKVSEKAAAVALSDELGAGRNTERPERQDQEGGTSALSWYHYMHHVCVCQT